MHASDPASRREDGQAASSAPASINTRDLINRFLDRWLHLTQLESQSILRGDWAELADLQTAKAALRRPLRAALEQWNASNAISEPSEQNEPFFRKTVDKLLALETRNTDLLTARKQAVLERKRIVDLASRNLRMVRDSYAGNLSKGWQAYS